MRAVAGSGSSNDPAPEFDRHLDLLSRAIVCTSPTVTLIARAPCSAPAMALIAMRNELARAGVTARAILAKLEPEAELKQLFATLSTLAPDSPPAMLIRCARNPRLHDAHEQATYGEAMCWIGDAMRRDADKRNALSLFHEDAPDRALLARAAFTAFWDVSVPVPMRYLRGDVSRRPLGEYERPPKTPAAITPPSGPQGWPLIRH